jgi:hypothetical protein
MECVKFSRKKKYDNMSYNNIMLTADNTLSTDNQFSDDVMLSADNMLSVDNML